jgi:hypothetical protein
MEHVDTPIDDMTEQQIDNIELYKILRSRNLHKMNPIPVFMKEETKNV